jgi:NADPH-dependent 2,4-dienoyl-CoA reductase/sulfur reductase-like enzyme
MHAGNGLYVAGDSAAFPLRGRPTRIEHWRVAQQQARVAAANILGGNVEDQGVPFFWTYHYGQTIEYLGHAEHWDRIEIIGDLAGWNFVALLITGDEVSAVVAAGRSRETSLLVERMRRKLSVEDAMQMIGSN